MGRADGNGAMALDRTLVVKLIQESSRIIGPLVGRCQFTDIRVFADQVSQQILKIPETIYKKPPHFTVWGKMSYEEFSFEAGL